LIVLLFSFNVYDYLDSQEYDWTTISITICTLGGYVTLSRIKRSQRRDELQRTPNLVYRHDSMINRHGQGAIEPTI